MVEVYRRFSGKYEYFLNIQSRTVSQESNMFLRNVGIRTSKKLQSITSQKTVIFIVTAVRISNAIPGKVFVSLTSEFHNLKLDTHNNT
jgi:hypothetical protein